MEDSPLCKRLKEARKAAKLSQKQLGIAAGMDEFSASARMNHYEIGRHAPDFNTLRRIAKVLKIPTAYFYAESDDLAEVIKLFDRLKKNNKPKLIKTLRRGLKKSS
ncbi:MAG: helix-turn-helix transcriptional regulator [Gammaproteobacteria bacterium]|nr:helix-turn-helix transcriptional regulator [Gammaproteobacteria bacterium]MCW5582945.1 helix-turn-helix transcriptional regulator [Gammaproteobacteria bacterium]